MVSILGPGLIGGSLGLALQQASPATRVRIWSRASSLARASEVFCDVTSDPREAVEGADVVVLCTPVGAMQDLARTFVSALSPNTVVTDAASVKGAVERLVGEILGACFVGAHPMAGSEKSGLGAARADLFQGATCILTPSSISSREALDQVETFWQGVGCRTVTMEAWLHDRLVARASHLPHVVASALVAAVKNKCPQSLEVAGSGYRDTTRVAGGPAAMWSEIFMQNKSEVLEALGEFRSAMAEFEMILQSGSVGELTYYLAIAQGSAETRS